MDIHRCRFIPYPPPSISAVAFSHPSDISRKAPKDLRLAIGRENGDIELWNPHAGRWVQETVLRGSLVTSIDQLAWTQDLTVENDGSRKVLKPGKLRLFSSGSGVISEWSLSSGAQVRHAESNFGQIWCFAAQPAYKPPKGGEIGDSVPSQLLVAGTQTGDVVLFSTTDGELRFQQLLYPAGKKSKVLSITWRDRNTVVTGHENGYIRVFDITTRKVLRQTSLGKTPEGSFNVVWAVRCLSDGTIVSGDSSGELKIWDAENFSLVQRLKSHQADILDITSSAKGDQIYSVGVDRRTVAYQAMPMQQGQKKRKWAETMHRRYHDHDTKCAASYESQGFSVLVSGGMDASPVLLPMRNWQSENHRTLPHLPQQPQLSTSRNRLVLTWWSNELYIYEIPRRQEDGELSLAKDDYNLLSTIRLKDEYHIQSAHISRDGRYILASTSKAVRLFQLRRSVTDGVAIVRSRTISLPTALQNYGARHVRISPDSRWLFAVRFAGTVIVAKLLPGLDSKSAPTTHAKLARLTPTTGKDDNEVLGSSIDQITNINVSADSRVLAVGDLSGRITAWTLEGHEDTSAALEIKPTKSSSDSDSSDSSDSDSEDEDDSPTIHAQRWTRATEFPRLDSSVLALCIRQTADNSSSPSRTQTSPQTNIALHPTRNNPRPLAHEHPTPNTTILVLTSNHSLTELSLTSGKLTPWSRRNPSSLLPARFRAIRDRALDIFLHGSRLWLYGSNWIYMLDLSQDFPQKPSEPSATINGDATSSSKKRKRHSVPNPTAIKGTGAGSRILNHRARPDSGVAPTSIKYKGEHGTLEVVDLEGRMAPASDDDDDESGGNASALVKLRREAEETPKKNGRKAGNGDVAPATTPSISAEYNTFQYRAIFGIGVLRNDRDGLDMHDDDSMDTDGDVSMNGQAEPKDDDLSSGRSSGLEVVIIERPMHEVPQAARFDGGQDWDV